MKNYYVIVETKKRGTSLFKQTVAQIKVEGYNKLQLGYEWGKVTNKYPEEYFDNHLSETKDEIREYQEDPTPYIIYEKTNTL
ncbi:hypothetical protein [Myroides marinus]|uniref:hypothetical protein n=1 Tax=Myroides marinus TaxID=703342 RepID=UPI00257662C8|nr:hypothetical protein [Myroides marinus]MDM1378191.1 hypothetical protein [Myroides marinus]MDM1385423.1 hypothetical protein [Myroides marinus]MDM1392636.1 hypothetical protein [Myroides marinus]MDM1502288.1 hypothetical protein [Myroides marinus]